MSSTLTNLILPSSRHESLSDLSIVSMASYLSAIVPNLLSRRTKVVPGYFWMKEPIGMVVNIVASLFMMAFIVIFCFPVLDLSPLLLSPCSFLPDGDPLCLTY